MNTEQDAMDPSMVAKGSTKPQTPQQAKCCGKLFTSASAVIEHCLSVEHSPVPKVKDETTADNLPHRPPRQGRSERRAKKRRRRAARKQKKSKVNLKSNFEHVTPKIGTEAEIGSKQLNPCSNNTILADTRGSTNARAVSPPKQTAKGEVKVSRIAPVGETAWSVCGVWLPRLALEAHILATTCHTKAQKHAHFAAKQMRLERAKV
ncbi:uncharacterized protein F5Z01DRAFT_175522 [Emericellopsis atlantica]|uniref:Uncharacterized protein n=1 Tax=Emericellopsis atlantica TaxID=2614577 RepID=A0A9P7ZJ92_9HYPO|nr:uncharacterized protein F5Z01DRAFT_175522 [Emericellopsis atlantica]KAG9253133.1 hypothetical protein F5Z01DRAFT_175522 [Emericellopsis atlantica]